MTPSTEARSAVMGRFIFLLLAVLAALAGVFVIAELWARAEYDELPVFVQPRELKLPPELVQPDPVLGQHFRPNAEAFFISPNREFKVHYQINEFGLRDSGLVSSRTRPRRVLVFGDAIAEGWGVMREAGFVLELQRQLRQLDGIDPATHVINAAMTGYGAAQNYLLGKRLLTELEADVMVFFYTGLMPVADHRFLQNAEIDPDGLAVSAGRIGTEMPTETTADGSRLEKTTLFQLAHGYLTARKARDALLVGDPEHDLFSAARDANETTVKLHERSLAHVAALAAIAKRRNMAFMLVHVPSPHQVAADEWALGRAGFQFEPAIYDPPETAIVEGFCRSQQMNCVMTTSMLRDLAEKRSSRVYFKYDYAMTEVGQRALVNHLLEPVRAALLGSVDEPKSPGL